MISSIRKQLKSTGFKVILWAIGLSILGGGSIMLFIKNSILKKPTTDIAFVDNLAISQMEFNRTANSLRQIMQIAPQLLPNLTQENLVGFILEDFLIPNKVLQNKAEKSGINVGTDYICNKLNDKNSDIQNLVVNLLGQNVYKNGVLDSDLLSKALKQQRISLEEFESVLKENLETGIFQSLISNGIYIPEWLIHEKYIRDYSKKKFSILAITLDNYIKKAESEKLSEEALENYFNNNKENYRVPEGRSVTLWTFDFNNYNIEVTDQELQDYYKEHHKDDKSFQDLKSKLEKDIKLNKFKQEFSLDAKRLLLNSDNIAAFNEFVKNKHGVKSEINDIVNEKDNINYQILSKKVFNLLKIGDQSFYENDGKGYIVKLKSIKPSYIPNLKEIKDKVIKDINKQKARDLINEELDNFVKSDKNIEQIEKEFKGAKLEKTDWVDFQKSNILFKSIPKTVLSNLFKLKQKEKYVDDKAYLIELSEIENFNQKDFNDKKETLEYSLMQEQLQNMIKDLQLEWINKAKVVFNESLIINKRK